jgi:tetratricopeptide (TPR) repeat protein
VEPESPIDRLAALERAFAEEPESAPFVELAQAHLALGHALRAVEVLKRGLATRPGEPGAVVLLARAELQRGNLRAAVRHCAALLRVDGADLDAMKLLGRALMDGDQVEEAWVVLERAQALAPEDPEVFGLRHEARVSLRRAAARVDPEIGVIDASGDVTSLLGAAERVQSLQEMDAATPSPPAGFTAYIKKLAFSAPPGAPREPPSESVIIDSDYREALADGSVVEEDDDTTAAMLIAEPEPQAPPHPETGGQTREALSPGLRVPQRSTPGPRVEPQLERTAESRTPAGRLPPVEQERTSPSQQSPGFVRSPAAIARSQPAGAGARIALPLFDFEERPPAPVAPEVGTSVSMVEPTHPVVAEASPVLPATQELPSPGLGDAEAGERPGTVRLGRKGRHIGADSLSVASDPPAPAPEEPFPAAPPPVARLEAQSPIPAAGPTQGTARAAGRFRAAPRSLDSASVRAPDGKTSMTAPPSPTAVAQSASVEQSSAPVSAPAEPTPPPKKRERRAHRPAAVEARDSILQPSPPPPVGASGRPASPPRSSAPPQRAVVADLLDLPLDPAEFDDMPPLRDFRPAPRPMPADLQDRVSAPAPRHGAPPPLPASNEKPSPARKRAPPQDPATPAAAQAAPPPQRPAPAPQRPAPNAKRPSPAAPAPAAPAPGGSPQSVEAGVPDYGDQFASYFDARTGERSMVPDAVADIVAAQKQRTPEAGEAGAGSVGLRARLTPSARRAVGWVSAAVLLAALLPTWRYRAQVNRLSADASFVRARLTEGTFAARKQAEPQVEPGAEEVDPLARFADVLVTAVGGHGLEPLQDTLVGLRARLEAERVLRDGDESRRPAFEEALRRARQDAPDAPDTALAAAWQALDASDFDGARKAADRALVLRPDDADAHWLWARAALAQGMREPAMERLGLALRAAPDHVGVVVTAAEQRVGRGQHGQALDLVQRLLDGPAHTSAEARIAYASLRISVGKREEDAATELRALLAEGGLSPHLKALAHDTLGRYAVSRNDLSAARAAFGQAIQAAPLEPRFGASLAALDLREFKLDDAEKVLHQAVHKHPEEPVHTEHLARARLARGDAVGALRVLAGAPRKTAQIALLRGRALLEQGRLADAEAALREARTEDSGLMDVRIYRALVAWLSERTPNRFDELRRLREGAGSRERLEDQGLRFRAVGEALLVEGDLDGALQNFGRALEVDPRDLLARFGRCRVHALAGRPDLALEQCRAVLEVNPAYVPAADEVASAAERAQDPQAVVAALSLLLAHEARPPSAVRRLARAYLRTGDTARATQLGEAAAVAEDATSRRYIEGLVALREDRLTDATRALAAVAEELPEDPFVLSALATATALGGEIDRAVAQFRSALSRTGSPEPALAAARAWLRVGRGGLARDAVDDAIARVRASQSGPRALAEALALRADIALATPDGGGLSGARTAVDDALRLAEDNGRVRLSAGRVAEVAGQPDEAARHFRRAAELEPSSAEAFYSLGRVLLGLRDQRDQGRVALEKASRMDPQGQFGRLAAQALRR